MVDIPTEIKTTLYIYWDTDSTWNPFSFFNFELTDPGGRVLIHKMELDIQLPPMSVEDIKGKLVLNLRQKKQDLITEHIIEVAQIDEKINQLLAIEYHPTVLKEN